MPPEYLNEILLCNVTKGLENQSYLQGQDFKGKTYKETCNMFERMEISEQVYEGGTTSKTTTREDFDRVIHGRRRKGGKSTYTDNLNL